MERRRFLKTIAAVPAVGVLSPTQLLAAPRFKISLAQWSLHRRLRGAQKPELDNLDFALTARELGIDAIEYVNSFFKKHAADKKYLARMKKRAADVGVKSLLIMVDGEGKLGDAKGKQRKEAVDNHKKWVDAAHFLGCHSIRVNASSSGTPEEQRKLVVEGLTQLTEYAKTAGLNVIVENHGGLSSNGAWLASVMKAVNNPRCGTLPDFGNFRL